MKQVILASTSKYRKELLLRLGLEFECMPPNVDEDKYKSLEYSPIELANKLAFEKAKAIHENNPEAIVIGSDQLAECDGTILNKPGNRSNAIEQISFLQGREHRLITSFTVFNGLQHQTKTNITILKMRNLSKPQIETYIDTDTPFDCAGSYKLEKHGISLFEKIQTDDHSSIIGLPLIELTNLLNEMGVITPPVGR